MRGRSKISTAVAVLLLAIGLAACGGGSGESTGSTAAEAGGARQEAGTGGSGSKKGEEGKEGESRKGEAAKFKPERRSDSGGGSQQYIVKGNDNSVQEYGAEASASEREAAAAVLHDFLDARAQGNWAASCRYLAKPVTESFERLASRQGEGASCAGILEGLTNPAGKSAMSEEAAKADVGSLRVQGDRAFVIYRGPKGAILAMPMTREGGEWKVATLAGTPLN